MVFLFTDYSYVIYCIIRLIHRAAYLVYSYGKYIYINLISISTHYLIF